MHNTFRWGKVNRETTIAKCRCFVTVMDEASERTRSKAAASNQKKALGPLDCHPSPVSGPGVGTHAFWRSVEGVETLTTRAKKMPTAGDEPDGVWMVSQACPIRRSAFSSMWLAAPNGGQEEGQWLSGGFMSEVTFEDTLSFHSQFGQQQWLTRNSNVGKQVMASSGDHNIVFANSGVKSVDREKPATTFQTSVQQTMPIVRKPYLRASNGGLMSMFVPPPETDVVGWSTEAEAKADAGSAYPVAKGCVAGQSRSTNATTTTKELQAMLGTCSVVLLLPAIYTINATLQIDAKHAPNLVAILGVGMATLRMVQPQPVFTIASSRLRLSGVMIDVSFPGGSQPHPDLVIVDWLDAKAHPDDKAHPHLESEARLEGEAHLEGGDAPLEGVRAGVAASVHDLFIRTWRDPRIANQWVSSSYRSMMRVRQPGLIIDHTWLWMADHDCVGYPAPSTVKHGLEVEADHVIAYGLQVEHHTDELVLWSGEAGATVMFQAEAAYTGAANPGCYTVSATTHTGYGIGSYGVTSGGHTATRVPSKFKGEFHNLLAMSITGPNLITHILCTGTGTDKCSGQAQEPGKSYHAVTCPASIGSVRSGRTNQTAFETAQCNFVLNHD